MPESGFKVSTPASSRGCYTLRRRKCKLAGTLIARMAICVVFVAITASVAAQRRRPGTQSKAPAQTSAASTPAWPQWGGPNRNFKVAAQGIKENWPAGAPKRLWSRPLGEGHSAILVEQGKLYTMYSSGNREVIISLDAETGKTVWEFPYEANTSPLDLSAGKGPHSTPLIVGNLVYAVGLKGTMHALDKNNGRMGWKHDLWLYYVGYCVHCVYCTTTV